MRVDNSKKNSFFKLDLLILSALRRQDCYGYEIVSIIKEHTNDMFVIKEGVMYPILYRLVNDHYISSYDRVVNSRNRLSYHLEPAGLDYLNRLIEEFDQGIEIVERFIAWSRETGSSKKGSCVLFLK